MIEINYVIFTLKKEEWQDQVEKKNRHDYLVSPLQLLGACG
jgi:hypothetical protein